MIEELKKYFSGQKDISMAFLFGSQAKNRGREMSDFDVAAWFKHDPSLDQINTVQRDIENLVRKDVDLIVLNSARPTVAWAAMRGKKLLIRNWALYLKQLLAVSMEAEDIQDFNIDLWKLREKARRAA